MKDFFKYLLILNLGFLTSCGDVNTLLNDRKKEEPSAGTQEEEILDKEEVVVVEKEEIKPTDPEVVPPPQNPSPVVEPIVVEPPAGDEQHIIPEQFPLLSSSEKDTFCLDSNHSIMFRSEEHTIKSCSSSGDLPIGLQFEVVGQECILSGSLSSEIYEDQTFQMTVNAIDAKDRIGSATVGISVKTCSRPILKANNYAECEDGRQDCLAGEKFDSKINRRRAYFYQNYQLDNKLVISNENSDPESEIVSCELLLDDDINRNHGIEGLEILEKNNSCMFNGVPSVIKDVKTYTVVAKTAEGAESTYSLEIAVRGPFVSTWNTALSRSFRLPLNKNGSYDFKVIWQNSDDIQSCMYVKSQGNFSDENDDNCSRMIFNGEPIELDIENSEAFKLLILGQFNKFESNSITSLNVIDQLGSLRISNVKSNESNGRNRGAFEWAKNLTAVGSEGEYFDMFGVKSIASLFKENRSLIKILPFKYTKYLENTAELLMHAQVFNQYLDFEDTSNVTDMSHMFSFASLYNQKLDLNTSNVRNMSHMFAGAANFNQLLGEKFYTSKVEDMSHMFSSARIFNRSLGENFDTSGVKDMSYMFYFAKDFNQPLNNKFNTRSVVDMSHMFHGATNYNQEFGAEFTTSSAKNISNMFHGAKNFNQSLDFLNLNSIRKFTNENFGRLLYQAKSISAENSIPLMEELVVQHRNNRSKFEEVLYIDINELPGFEHKELYNSVFCNDDSRSEVRINWKNGLAETCL